MAGFMSVLGLSERAFRDEKIYRVSRLLLVIALFLIHVAGSELIACFYTTPYVAGLTSQQMERSTMRFAFGPPHSRDAGPTRGLRLSGPVAQALGIVFRSMIFVLAAQVLWWVLVIFVQFLGGEEDRTEEGNHRNSRYLVLCAWFPLAFRRLAEGVLIHFQDPAAAWSAVNLAAYRSRSSVSFSPLSALGLPPLPGPLSFLVYGLTDPFVLWFLFIIAHGGGVIFHLKGKSSLLLAVFVLLFLYLLRVLSSTVGISMGV